MPSPSPPPSPRIRQTNSPRRRASSCEHYPQDLELQSLSKYTRQLTVTPYTSTAAPVPHPHTRDSTVPPPGGTFAGVPASQVEPPDLPLPSPPSPHRENFPHFPTPSPGLLNTSCSPITVTPEQAPSLPHPLAPASPAHIPSPSSPSSLQTLQELVSDTAPPLSGPMASANFPLLRTSPAIGTGSYGALPTMVDSLEGSSYTGSALSSTSEEESTGEVEDSSAANGVEAVEEMEGDGFLLPEGHTGDPQGGRNKKWPKQTDTAGLGLRERESKTLDKGSVNTNGEPSYDVLSDSDEEGIENEDNPIDNSPYPEVRASVPAKDDPDILINTPRMWTLAMFFSLVGSATNLFFSLRYPSVSITPVIALLLAHPLGKLWDHVFHEDDAAGVIKSEKGRWGRFKTWLGQGRWNQKEHSCVYISSNVSFGFAFATDVIVEQTHFYHQNPGVTYQILLTLSTQILGYTFAGLTRQWLVYPGAMIWPGTLMSTAMFTTLHGEENKVANGWRISRFKFFLLVFIGGFFWYFVPGLLMPALSYFNAVTWFAPDNVPVANLFGVASGLGMFPLTFDWAQISYVGSPLMTPFWAAANVVAGLVVVMWVVAPILYYGNALYSSYMPILSSAVFDNTGHPYDVSKILTKDFLFDEVAYKNYSRVFLPITYVLSYGLQFAALTALVTHTACWHGKDIWRQWGRVRKEFSSGRLGESASPAVSGAGYVPITNGNANRSSASRSRRGSRHGRRRSILSDREWDELTQREDVHMRLMRRYREAPTSWYLATFLVMIAVGIFVVEYYPVHLPWYGLLLALGVCGTLFVPIGIVMAITNQQSSIFLICQLICGALFPGRPVANMVFVTYGYITSTQGLKFAADLKLGHYMKIPPRLLFSVQMAATCVSSLTQIGVLNWMFASIPGLCTPQAMNGFTCPIARVHFNGSVLWGVVGPRRFFGKGELYRSLMWAFAVGALAPIVLFAVYKYAGKGGNSRKTKVAWLRKVSLPVVFGSLSWIPPATGLNFSTWVIVCFVFNYYLFRRAPAWWGKYTMTLSAALDASLAVGLVVVFFGFIYPGWMEGFSWWGTEVYKRGCDWKACAYLQVPEGGVFGPGRW